MDIIIPLWLLITILVVISPLVYIFCHTLVRRQRLPADTSNRINAIRLAWFCASREHLFIGHIDYKHRLDLFLQGLCHEERFVDVPACWFLRYDEYDVVTFGRLWLESQQRASK